MSTHTSVCALDCPDACSLLVDFDPATQRASKLRGNPAHPVTRGFLCGKVAKYLDRSYHPDRLMYPMRRTGAKGSGRFERVSWDEAIGAIASRLGETALEFGAESILPYSYAGTMGLIQGSGMDRRFFHALGASRLDRTICSVAGTIGMAEATGSRYSPAPEDFRHAKLILAWGANVLGTNVHLWPFIVEARRSGARFYTIDPHRNRTGRVADRHYAIRPGSDAALAFAMMHVLIGEGLVDRSYLDAHTLGFTELAAKMSAWTPARAAELTGLSVEEIVGLAREYGTTRPAAIRVNYGVQRSERGAMSARAIGLLPALTGAWRDQGGGVQLSTSNAFKFNLAALERPDLGGHTRVVNMSLLGDALTKLDSPPVKAIVVYNSNPAAIAPDLGAVRRGMLREDLFTVVLEQFQTDTADYADYLLPATTFLEHSDLYRAYGHYYVQLARPAMSAPGECLPNTEIFRRLARAMGLNDPALSASDDDLIRAALDTDHPHMAGISLERLEAESSIRLNLPTPFLPYAEGGFGTASGKCEFCAETLAYTPPVESRLGDAALLAKYPLELITPKNDDSMNSTFGNRAGTDAQTGVVTLHPGDAAARGVVDGDAVRIVNDRGAVVAIAKVADSVARGVVCVPAVRWAKLSPGGQGINVLASQRLTDKGGGPVFYSCLVQVEKTGS